MSIDIENYIENWHKKFHKIIFYISYTSIKNIMQIKYYSFLNKIYNCLHDKYMYICIRIYYHKIKLNLEKITYFIANDWLNNINFLLILTLLF